MSHPQHICRCECSHANSLHVICLFSPLSGFTFHTLSSLGVLGTGDLKWLRAGMNLREIQLALCVLRLQSYSCFIAAWCREEKERGREKLGGVEKEKKRGRKKRTRERKSRQPWFSVTPPQASCAIFNTQAYVLSNLSCPGF